MKRFYVIPIFLPQKACPFQCIYCNQYNISDRKQSVSPEEVRDIIDQHLQTFPFDGVKKVGFFGGSFTGMPVEEQNSYLSIAAEYVRRGEIAQIQLSTRPDYITKPILENLKRFHVQTIELGVQSLDDEVLTASQRGYSVENVYCSSQLIREAGFDLGLQMMIGLPKDTLEKSLQTARKIVELGAVCTRIYPTLVIKGTELETIYNNNDYRPLGLEEAVNWTKEIMKVFLSGNVTVFRVGLHPSKGLVRDDVLIAGAFHVSFKELMMTELWKDILLEKTKNLQGEVLEIRVPFGQLNVAIGYNASNKKMLLKQFRQVKFIADENITTEYQCKCAFLQ